MIRYRLVPNTALVAAERDDFNYWDPEAATLTERIRRGAHPTRPLSSVAHIAAGLTPAKEEYSFERGPGDRMILKVANLSNAGVRWEEERLSFVSKEFFEKTGRAHVQRYDLLMLAAAHQRRYIGKRIDIVDAFPDDAEGSVMAVAELLVIRPNLDLINPFYLLAALQTPTVQELIAHLVRGQTGHLYADDLGSLEIPVPLSIETQKQLAAQVLAARSFVRRALAEAETLRAAVSAQIDDDLYGDPEDRDAPARFDSIDAPGVRASVAVEFRELRDAVELDVQSDLPRASAPADGGRSRRRRTGGSG